MLEVWQRCDLCVRGGDFFVFLLFWAFFCVGWGYSVKHKSDIGNLNFCIFNTIDCSG